ncbi:MAG: dipeptidase PepE [Bacteroidota bacterium]
MRLLLISNSTNAGEAYLNYPKNNIKEFFGTDVKTILFVPYAAVTFSFDEYVVKVQERMTELGYKVVGIHSFADKAKAVKEAEAIMVGGGNTWQLLSMMQEFGLVEAIRNKVIEGTPFVGWSAGSNVACPTIKTTNDMPIIQPQSFNACNLVPFQINPHYLDANPDGHAGETREQRIMEFLEANKNTTVLGLREGCMLLIENKTMRLIGPKTLRLFKYKEEFIELANTEKLDFLL